MDELDGIMCAWASVGDEAVGGVLNAGACVRRMDGYPGSATPYELARMAHEHVGLCGERRSGGEMAEEEEGEEVEEEGMLEAVVGAIFGGYAGYLAAQGQVLGGMLRRYGGGGEEEAAGVLLHALCACSNDAASLSVLAWERTVPLVPAESRSRPRAVEGAREVERHATTVAHLAARCIADLVVAPDLVGGLPGACAPADATGGRVLRDEAWLDGGSTGRVAATLGDYVDDLGRQLRAPAEVLGEALCSMLCDLYTRAIGRRDAFLDPRGIPRRNSPQHGLPWKGLERVAARLERDAADLPAAWAGRWEGDAGAYHERDRLRNRLGALASLMRAADAGEFVAAFARLADQRNPPGTPDDAPAAATNVARALVASGRLAHPHAASALAACKRLWPTHVT